jgi:hypothetical protein
MDDQENPEPEQQPEPERKQFHHGAPEDDPDRFIAWP